MFATNQTREEPTISEDMLLEEMIPIEEQSEIFIDPETGDVVEESLEVSLGLETIPFNANLATILSEEELKEIGCDICEKVKADKESRKRWYDTLKNGLDTLGIYCPDDDADTGIQRVTHPLLIEAATQFQARAMAELLPPGGPVKGSIVGLQTEETTQQAQRVEEYMNYQLTVENRGYYEERDQMLYLLPFTGSEFDKQYDDPTTGRVLSRWVRSDHFIVPYDAKSLETAPRYTHELHMTLNEYRKAVKAGMYTDVLLDEEDPDDTMVEEGEEAPLTEKLLTLDGQEKPASRMDGDKEMVLYETHIDYDLEGFEEDIALPFVITVDSKTEKVVSIRRNWKELDELKLKRIHFTHKKFLPGFGFYGFGLLHAIGNLGEAATEILRILIDAGAFATLQGGFKSKDAKLKGDIELTPGTWNDTEMTADELARAFYTPPFKEPSQVLFSLLGMITELGQRFAATTETMVGDAATTGPVGTMVAQIEQGSKVFSGIHKRLHYAFGTEFIHIADLNGETLPDAYPYMPKSGNKMIMRSDFDGRVDVIPVSDPNIFSSAQRIAMAQTALQLAQSMPDIADRRKAAVGLLAAMRFPNPEAIFPEKAKAQRLDPVSENAALLVGRPIKAYIEQHHQAHNASHMAQLQALPEQYRPLMMAHMMEHEAMNQMMLLTQRGVPLPPVDWSAEVTEPMFQELPPELETQVAMMAAQALQQMMQQQQAAQQAQQPQGQQQADPAAEEARKNAAFQGEEQRKQAAFEAEQARKDQQLAISADREDALAGIEPSLVKQAGEFLKASGIQMSPRELAVMAKALGQPFSAVVQAISRLSMQNQGGGPAPIAQGMNQQRAIFM